MKDKYTLIFIPPGHSSTRQLQFSKLGKRYLGVGMLLIGVMIIGLVGRSIYLSHYLKGLQPTIDHISQLQSTIEARDQEISNLNQKSTQINGDLTKITDLEGKLSTILPLNPSASKATPSRGLNVHAQSYIFANPPVLTPIQNTQTVAEHLSLLQGYYDEAVLQKDRLDHTPSMLPAQGEITSYFGYRHNPFGQLSTEFHHGIDIGCSYGTPVLATADGIVIYVGTDPVYGQSVDIDHGHGIVTFYGHNSRLLVKQGDRVKKRDLIAYSGNSGRSTGAHLHYGTIVNGENVDPQSFTIKTEEVYSGV